MKLAGLGTWGRLCAGIFISEVVAGRRRKGEKEMLIGKDCIFYTKTNMLRLSFPKPSEMNWRKDPVMASRRVAECSLRTRIAIYISRYLGAEYAEAR